MTQKTRANLTTEITTLIADAPAANISALDVRTTLLNSKDSNLNILTDTSDVLTEGTTKLLLTPTERTRVAREWQTATRSAGVDFTPAISTTLVLPAAAPSDDEDYVRVDFEGVRQATTQWTISGATITFIAAIPSGVSTIELQVLA